MSDDDITRLRTLAQADAAARHRAMQWHADQRLTDQDDDEVHHTTEALRARLDGFVILELLDRQRRDKPAPSAEQVGHLHSNGDFCWKRSIAPELWPVPLYASPPAPSAEPVESQLVMLARILRCRYPVDKSIRSNGFDWDISRLNEVVAELHLTAPSAEPAAFRYLYSDGFWRFSNGSRVNGGDPIEAQPLYTTPPDHTALLRQALEALEERYVGALRDSAIDALRAALEPKQC